MNSVWMIQSRAAPRIGPSYVPRPPTSTMKIMYAVHCTLKIDVGWMKSVLARVSAPAAPQPIPARTKRMRLPATTRTPTDAAAASSSRIAWSDAPRGLRSRTKSTTISSAVAPSAHQ